MDWQPSPADQGSRFDGPVALLETRQVAVTEAQGLDPANHTEFPVALRDVAEAEVLPADQQPVIRERRVAEAGQVGVGKRRTGCALVRVLRYRNCDPERVIVEIVIANVVEQATSLRIAVGEVCNK
jgi:hypothetical protein